MTAEEIRKLRDDNNFCRIDGSLEPEEAKVFFLSEIAAQLAEYNRMTREWFENQRRMKDGR